jgi:phage-related protein
MAIIGVASIRVRPDLTRFRSELDAELRKIDRDFKVNVRADTSQASRDVDRFVKNLNQKDATVRVDVDRKRVQKDIGDVSRDLFNLSVTAGSALAKGTVGAVGFSVALAGLASSLAGTASLIGGVGQAVVAFGGAAVGVGAAGLAALAAGAATVKLGLVGMSDAFKAITEGDAKALNEALKKMAPAGREFVQEVAKFKPVLDQLRLDVQQNLFKDLAKEIQLTGNAVSGVAREQFTELSKVLNNVAKDVLGFFREARTLKELKNISTNVTGGFREAQGAAKSMASAVLDIVSAGSELLPELGAGIEGVTARFAAFIRGAKDSGQLTEFFRQSIETVKQFGRILRDFGVGISNVFKIGSETSGGFLSILEKVAAKFREWTESFSGQVFLTNLFETINDLAGAFGGLLKALSPLLPLLGRLFSVLADSVIQILEEIGPVLEEVGRALINALIETLPIITPIVIQLAEGMGRILKAIIPLIPTLARVLEALTPLIDPFVRLVESVLPPLIKLIEKLTPLIQLMAEGLGLILDVIGGAVRGFENLGEAIKLALNPLETFERLFRGVLGISKEGDGVGRGFGKVGDSVARGIADGIDGGQGRAIAAINNLFGAMDKSVPPWYAKFFSHGSLTWEQVGRGITDEQSAVIDNVKNAISSLLGLLKGQTPGFGDAGKSMGSAFSQGLTSEQQKAYDIARRIVDNILAIFSGRKPQAESEGAAITRSLGGGMASNQEAALGAARSISFSIGGIFGGVSLFGEGASIMSSLRSGLVSGIQAVRNVLTSMTSLIPTWKGPESVDKRLLIPAGVEIMRGLIRGIESEEHSLESTLGRVTNRFTDAFDPRTASIRAEMIQRTNISGGLEPTRVIVDVNVNDDNLTGIIDGRVSENNRTISRFGKAGVSS